MCCTFLHLCYPTEEFKSLLTSFQFYSNLLKFLQKLHTLFYTPTWRLLAFTVVNTPTEIVVSSMCFPDKDKSTPSTVIVFPLSIRCRNTNKPFNAGKQALPSMARTQVKHLSVDRKGWRWVLKTSRCYLLRAILDFSGPHLLCEDGQQYPPVSKTHLQSST